MDHDEMSEHLEENNPSVEANEKEAIILEDGFAGGVETSPEMLEAEDVEGYNYGFLFSDLKTGDVSADDAEEVSGSAEEVTATAELQEDDDDEETLVDAWYGSFDDEPANTEALEVVIGADDRVKINGTTSYPWRAIVSLRMETKTGKAYIGTGWMVSPRTIITAGHCVYFHKEGGWAKKIRVVAGRNGNSWPYGHCYGYSFKSVKGWTSSKKRIYDYGAIILPSSCKIGNTVGYFGYAYRSDSNLKQKFLNLSGYPGDKGGKTQWYHGRKAKSVTSRTIVYNIDTAGGQSGAPVWFKSGSQRYVIGIHTNGHSSGNSATRVVKPVFNNIKKWKNMGF